MNNLAKLVVFAILFFIFCVAFGYFKSLNKPVSKAPAYVTYSDIDQEVGKTAKDYFVEGCTKNNIVSFKDCSCAYDYILENMGQREFLKMALDIQKGGDVPPIIMESLEYCISK